MKIIVFGGSGFLGSHVADVLLDVGHNVIIYDKVPSEHKRKGHTFILGDVCDKDKVFKAVKGCDVIYNFAAVANIDKAKLNPLETVRSNVLGNAVLLEAARLNNVKRFVFASSIYVHSEAGSFYRSSKQACELLIENYHKNFGLNFTILRYGSLYGTRANSENRIHNMIKQACESGEIIYDSDGNESRDYLHVKDAADFSARVILSNKFKNKYLNIVSPMKITGKELLKIIQDVLKKKIKIKYNNSNFKEHYKTTPYTYSPKKGEDLICQDTIDLKEGLKLSLKNLIDKNGNS